MDTKPRIRLKCRFGEDVRIVVVSEDSQYNQIHKRLCDDYGFIVCLKYQDDGDLVTLASQADL
jgi:hypothetical protein